MANNTTLLFCTRCKTKQASDSFQNNSGYPSRGNKRHWCKRCVAFYRTIHRFIRAQYETLATKQRNVCAICHQPETERGGPDGLSKKRMAFDLDRNNKIRGLLCAACNRGLGAFKENIKNLKRAVIYLEQEPINVEVVCGQEAMVKIHKATVISMKGRRIKPATKYCLDCNKVLAGKRNPVRCRTCAGRVRRNSPTCL